MKVTLVPPDNLVLIDGRAATVDLSDLLGNDDGGMWRVRAVQWDGESGRVERFIGAPFRINSLDAYQVYIDAALAIFSAEDNPPPPPLDDRKAAGAAHIDAEAGRARAQFITVTPGQEMTYLEKVTQARAFGADPDPDVEDYPLLYGEIGITGQSAIEVAGVILGRYAQWQQIGAVIESTRLTAKRDVAAAVDAETVDAILAALSWPQP